MLVLPRPGLGFGLGFGSVGHQGRVTARLALGVLEQSLRSMTDGRDAVEKMGAKFENEERRIDW